MDMTQWPEALTWHYAAAQIVFAIMGVAVHLLRGLVNAYPDRLSDNPAIDMVISDGFNLKDYLFGTEYDDHGFYRVDSIKNLRIAVSSSMVGGFAAMLLAPGFSRVVAHYIDTALAGIVSLFWMRLDSLTWF